MSNKNQSILIYQRCAGQMGGVCSKTFSRSRRIVFIWEQVEWRDSPSVQNAPPRDTRFPWYIFLSLNFDCIGKINDCSLLRSSFRFNPITPAVSDQRLPKIFEGTPKIIIAIFLSEKNFSKFRRKILKNIFELKMAIAQSIFKILGSSFLQTPLFF